MSDRCPLDYLLFSSPDTDTDGPASVRRRPSLTISNSFFSETAGPIKAKVYMEPPWVEGTIFFFAASGSHDQDGRHARIW